MPLQTVVSARRPRPTDRGVSSGHGGRAVRSRAPLRLGLAGGGTDISPYCDTYGGMVLNPTINRYCYATISERDDGRVAIHAPDLGLSQFSDEEGGALSLHAAVYRRLCARFDLGSPSVTVTTAGRRASRLGFGIVVHARRGDYRGVPGILLPALGEYDIAHLAYLVERVDCGLEGGRQDQYRQRSVASM